MGANDLLLLLLPIGGLAIAYAGNIGGFKAWADSALKGGDNRCWEIGNGKKACACAGKPFFEMGAGRTCSHCEAACRGADPNAIPNTPVTGGADRCSHNGKNYVCTCAGSAPFNMGAGYNTARSTEACSACKTECNKRKSGYARAYASYPMKGLIVS